MADISSYVEQERPRTMGEIAKEIGVSRPFLYQLLSADRYPSIGLAVQIAEATDGAVPVSSWPNLAKVHAAIGGGA